MATPDELIVKHSQQPRCHVCLFLFDNGEGATWRGYIADPAIPSTVISSALTEAAGSRISVHSVTEHRRGKHA